MKSQPNEKSQKKKKGDEDEEIDIDSLLDQLKKHIIGVYDNIPNSH